MSQENVETIRWIYDRWERERQIDVREFDPEFEMRTPSMKLEERTHRGYEGYRAWRADNEEVTSENWFEAESFRDLGDHVLVSGWVRLTGKSSGVQTRDPYVQLWSFRGGKPSRMEVFRTPEEALEAVGLSEQDAHADSS